MTDDANLVSPSVLHSLREIKQSIWYRIGTLHEDMNDPEAALTAFEKVLVQNPSNAPALAKIGILLMKKECYRDAISYLHSSVSISPENSPAWVALAYSYVMSEELDNAYQAYHTAMSKMTHHNDPTLWYGVGIMYDRMGLLDHALDAFHAVLNIAPHYEAADKLYYDIGLIYKEQHKFEHAHKYMTRVVSTKVQQPVAYAEAFYQIGHIHELAGNIPSAMESYHSALTRLPNHVKSLQSLAWLTYKSGNVDEASRLLGHASRVEPTDANTFYLIGRMAMATNDYHKAYDNYQHAVYRDGKNANFWCAIGILYFHMRQHRDAMDAYTRAIRINPQMPEVWYDMGTLYEVYNQMNDAMDAYRRVLQLQPNDPQATQRLTTVTHAASNGVMPSTPSPLPRTEGPAVSPASAARPHSRSEAPERIGALPAPPRAPVATNLSTSAPAPYHMSIPTSQVQATKPVSTVTSAPPTSAQVDQKLGPPRPSPIMPAANGIVADSNAYPPVSQAKSYPNGGHSNMIGNGPAGYSTAHDRRSGGPIPPASTVPEASSQLSSLNNQHQNGGNFSQSRIPPEPISSRPVARMPQDEKGPGGITSEQVVHPSQPLNSMSMQTSHMNGSPRRSLPLLGPGTGHGPVGKPGEKQDHWNGGDARRNGYGENRARPDTNSTLHIPREIRADQSQYGPRGPPQSHPGAMNGPQRPEYHSERSDPGRNEGFHSQGDKSPGARPPQNHQRPAGPVPPNVNSMPSDDRSRLSASSSYERKATPAEALHPNTSKEMTRTSGEGSVRSTENENRYGSPASRNSRRSLPAPLPGPPTGFNGRPQALNMPTMTRGDEHLDEAMLPRLRPLPDNKPSSPRKDRDSKASAAGNQGGPLAPVRQLDNGTQPASHLTWNDSHSPAAPRGSLHGTPQQTNGGSPRSQHSPSGGRIPPGDPRYPRRPRQIFENVQQTDMEQSRDAQRTGDGLMPRDQTPSYPPGGPRNPRRPGQIYGNIQQTDAPQPGGAQRTGDGRNSAGLNHGNDAGRFQEERDGGRMRQYSTHASMSPRESNVENSSGGEGLKGSGQAPPQSTAMTSDTYGGGRSSTPAQSGQAESERDQFAQPGPDRNRPTMSPSNGYHRRTPGSADGGNRSTGGHEMRPTTKSSPSDSHFGSGTPPSFSKSLPRVSASNGLMSAPLGRKETDGSADQSRTYYERTQASYGGSERRSADVSNGYESSPRGNKRKMSDLVDSRADRSEDKQYSREQGEPGTSDGKAGMSGLGRPDGPLYSQMNARTLPEPISNARGDGEDGGHPQKRLRAHGMGEEGLAPLVNGGQLKSRE